MGKQIVVTFYRQNHLRPDWRRDVSSSEFEFLFLEMEDDLRRFGISLSRVDNDDMAIDVASYADVLNAVRISSPSDGVTNLCIGHIIGKSPNLDLTEDLRRAVNRIAFAPETVPPDDHNRKTCHNCGCGC